MTGKLSGFSFPAALARMDASAPLAWPARPSEPHEHDPVGTLEREPSSGSLMSATSAGSGVSADSLALSAAAAGGKLRTAATESMSKSVRRFINRDNGKLSCGICKREFTWENSLVRHITCVHAGIKKFSCKRCGKCFKGNHGLKYHMNAKICTKKGLGCGVGALASGRAAARGGARDKQLRRKLNTYSSTSSTGSMMSISSADSGLSDEATRRAARLGQGGLAPTAPKPSCRECGECFDTVGEMNEHRAVAHAAHQCDFCHKSFNSTQSLQAHKELSHGQLFLSSPIGLDSPAPTPQRAAGGVDYDFLSTIYDVSALLASGIKHHAAPLFPLASVTRPTANLADGAGLAASPHFADKEDAAACKNSSAPSISPNTSPIRPTGPSVALQSAMLLARAGGANPKAFAQQQKQPLQQQQQQQRAFPSASLAQMLEESCARMTPSQQHNLYGFTS